jgi:hypothetical protein
MEILKQKPIQHYEAYLLFNSMIMYLISFAIFYVVVNRFFGLNMPCEYKIIYGHQCRSCGLTRGLYSCLSLHFQEASTLNNQSVFYFLTFIIQLGLRQLIRFISIKDMPLIKSNYKLLFGADIVALIIILTLNIIMYG